MAEVATGPITLPGGLGLGSPDKENASPARRGSQLGSKDGDSPSKDAAQGVPRTQRRRSSIAFQAGVSIEVRDRDAEASKPLYLKEVANPILEAMAMKYHEMDEAAAMAASFDDLVSMLMQWIQRGDNGLAVDPPPESEHERPSADEVAKVRQEIKVLQGKLAEVVRVEKQSSGTQKMNMMVRRLSNARRMSGASKDAPPPAK